MGETMYSFTTELSLPHKEFGAWLMSIKLLSSTKSCENCVDPVPMRLHCRTSRKDLYVWDCPRCRSQVSLRDKSFFALFSDFDLKVILRYILVWALNNHAYKNIRVTIQQRDIASYRRLGKELDSIAIDSFHRNLPGILGGINFRFQVDESLFVKRKAGIGRLIKERWVVGILDEYNNRAIFQVVPDRTHRTLRAVIMNHVSPGSTVTTDGWRAYNGLNLIYIHHRVNHSIKFVDPVTGLRRPRQKQKSDTIQGTSLSTVVVSFPGSFASTAALTLFDRLPFEPAWH
ncbi:uncharacterized protein [Watersipora subatra]|uniref:uncharacterized protein n=1 Tax=Watersipora subatra TaxID=2589382 RepID=UPI00355C07B0